MEMHTARSLMEVPGLDAGPESAKQGLASQMWGLVGGAATRWAEWRRYRAALNELNRLDDRMLRDIGLERGDIERVARAGAGVVGYAGRRGRA